MDTPFLQFKANRYCDEMEGTWTQKTHEAQNDHMRLSLSSIGRTALPALAALCGAFVLQAISGQAQRTQPSVPHYRVDPFWPQALPENWILAEVSGVAVDRQDHVWIVQRPRTLTEKDGPPPTSVCCVPAPPVIEFDPAGKVIQAWGGSDGYPWPAREHGISVEPQGN